MEENTAVTNEVDNEAVEKSTESSEVADTEQGAEAEFTDTEENTESNIEESKPKQDSKTNAEFARKRREAEKAKAIAEARKQARLDTIKELGITNKYTGELIEDDDDLELYNAMKDYEKNGGDPVADQSKIYKKMFSKRKAEEVEKANFNNEVKELGEAHPDINVEEVLNSARFQKFAKGKANMSLNEIYTDYAELFGDTPKTNDVEAKKEAIKKSNVGSLKGQTAPQDNRYYTDKQLSEMSREEVLANYDKVMASMEHNNKRR